MASDKNDVIIAGNLVRDPEMRSTPRGTPVCTFSIASNRFYKSGDNFEKETSFFDVQCWANLAYDVNNNCRKGTPVEVKGRLKQERWQKDGVNHNRIIIVAESVNVIQRQGYQKPQEQHENCPF